MKKRVVALTLGVLITGLWANSACASPLFVKALREKYDYKLVSCYTCHAKGDDPKTGEPYGKEVRNDFGHIFEAALKGKEVTARMLKAKEALEAGDDATKEKIDTEITKDFLEALGKVEAQKAADGKTYGDKFKAGEIEGVKLKE
jgi:hypothetical protein